MMRKIKVLSKFEKEILSTMVLCLYREELEKEIEKNENKQKAVENVFAKHITEYEKHKKFLKKLGFTNQEITTSLQWIYHWFDE
jgi:DNA-binding protein H-NS